MFQEWRLKLREAKAAYQGGRLDEAGHLLRQGNLRGFLPAQQLSACVARSLIERARTTVDGGDTSTGWRDLEAATLLGGEDRQLRALRGALIARGLAEATDYLTAEQPQRALDRLGALERRGGTNSSTRTLKQVARFMEEARQLGRRGKFSAAEVCLASAQSLAPQLHVVEKQREQCRLNMAESRRWCPQLHQAVMREDWTAVLEAAEALLAIAPDNAPAAAARRRAWEAAGMETSQAGRKRDVSRREEPAARQTGGSHVRASNGASIRSAKGNAVDSKSSSARFLVWVDAVGGFLVCLGDQIVLGQPTPGSGVDVPILANLSCRHAVIRRDGEGYLLEPIHEVWIDGSKATGPAELRDGDLIELGGSVQLRFRKPHALSGTARLDMVSHHKTQPSADAVLLMADSCVLGNGPHNHVQCRDWTHDVVLFRHGDELHCRTTGVFQIDGRACETHGHLTGRSQVEGEDFSFSLELLELDG